MATKSPVFPMAEPQHFSDYGFDPQIDYFQVLEEARKHKKEATRSIDALHFKLQKPISKDDLLRKGSSKKKRRWWWWLPVHLGPNLCDRELEWVQHSLQDHQPPGLGPTYWVAYTQQEGALLQP